MAEYTFEGQRPEEDVIFVVKRHPWVLASAGFIVIVLVVILIVLILIFGFSAFTSIAIFAIVGFFVVFGLYQWFVFNNYLYILTNERIIIIEQLGIFKRKVIEAELEKIQNITIEVNGPVKTMLNFGNIVLRTAGIDPVMVMVDVENPYDLQQKIIKHCKNYSESLKAKPVLR